MAKEYKVIALSVGGRFNKIYHSGDVVKSEDFQPGRAEALAAQGFLSPILAAEEEVIVPIPPAEEVIKVLKISDITAKEIKKQLTDLGIEFDKDSSKEDLFALLPKSL